MPSPSKKPGAKPPRIGDYVVLPIDEVEDDPQNENFHPESQLILLRASIRLDGQQEPILIDRNNRVIGGHGIKAAMKAEGHHFIECKYSDLKGAARSAYRIRTNQLARLSHFAPDILELNVKAIAKQLGKKFKPEMLALDQHELDHILHRKGWQSRRIDPESIGKYLESDETFILKIEGIRPDDKDPVLEKVSRAVKSFGYEAKVF